MSMQMHKQTLSALYAGRRVDVSCHKHVLDSPPSWRTDLI